MKLTEENSTVIFDEQNGDFTFSTDDGEWIVGPGNIPEFENRTPAGPFSGKRKRLLRDQEQATAVMEYAQDDEKISIFRTLEYCPRAGSFTVQDEPEIPEGITEILKFAKPVGIVGGTAVAVAGGQKVTVFVRNQENLRVEIQYVPVHNTLQKIYCLKWEMRKGSSYTCCQIEIGKLENKNE